MSSGGTTIREQLLAGKTVVTFTRGTSMQPLLYEGKTHVVIESICRPDGSKRALRKGELPIYQGQNGTYVIHRLVAEDAEYYYTRGDNCIYTEKVPKVWVLGTVTEIYRGEKPIKTTDWQYKLYVRILTALFPARKLWYRLRAKIKKAL